MKVVIIDYGAGNVFSVRNAVRKLGEEALVSGDPAVIQSADRVIFPGVGQAFPAMEHLRASGLAAVIPQLKMPVLGICLGMQLMCDASEEGTTQGLGIFPLQVKKMVGEEKVPHMGWNTVYDLQTELFARIRSGERMYFVHSYYIPDSMYTIARCDYQQPFAAAIRKDNFYGCQFHPEKSAGAGELLLSDFLFQLNL